LDDLTLPERFLLLALEERSGEFAGRQAPLDVARGLIGTALFELYLRGHIRFLSSEEMRVIRTEIEALLGVPLDLLEAQWPGGFRPLRRAACQVADAAPPRQRVPGRHTRCRPFGLTGVPASPVRDLRGDGGTRPRRRFRRRP